MAENAELAVGRDPVWDYQDLMAAVGRMVVGAETVEYSVALLVAVTEGHRDQAAADRAIQLVRKDGAAVREPRKLADGPPERRHLTWLCQNEAVVEGQNVVVHAIPLEDITAGEEGGLIGWHPRSGQEIWLTTPAVLGHVEDFGTAWSRLDEAIAAAASQTGARRVIRRPAVFGGPPWGPAPKPLGVPSARRAKAVAGSCRCWVVHRPASGLAAAGDRPVTAAARLRGRADLRQDSGMADRYHAPGGWTVEVVELAAGRRPLR